MASKKHGASSARHDARDDRLGEVVSAVAHALDDCNDVRGRIVDLNCDTYSPRTIDDCMSCALLRTHTDTSNRIYAFGSSGPAGVLALFRR